MAHHSFTSLKMHSPSALASTQGLNHSSTSTLRARLLSQESPKPVSSSPKHPLYPDFYQQFRAYFNNDTNQIKGVVISDPAPKDCDAVTKLREAFARTGMALHASAMDNLILAHVEVQSNIDSFAEVSGAALAQCDSLYNNIAYPLSRTLCRNETLPRATIETHLSNLKQDLDSTVKELEALQKEWQACVQTEQAAWKELTEPKRVTKKVEAETEEMISEYKAEAQDIVDEKCQALTNIDKEFKVQIQAQMARIMQLFVDDI